MTVGFPTPLLPLRNPVFRAFWTANLASNLGTLVQTVGASWMMTLIAGSADMVTLVQAAAAAPIVLFSVVAGAVADNFDRRRVMLVAQICMLVVSILLTAVALADLLTPGLLLAFTFLLGCGTALHTPSWQASFADIVPRKDLPAAVALNGMGFNITRGIGPALGGVIVAALGATAAFIVNAVSYVALIAALWRWQPPARANMLPRESLSSAVMAGLRYIVMSPHLEAILLRAFVFTFAVVSVLALLPILARDQLRGGALLYGLLFGSFGVGGVAGALVSGAMRARFSTESYVRLSFAGFAVCTAVLAVTDWVWLASLALFIGGACWVLALSMFNIGVQLSTPRWVVGRSLALYQTANFGGQALGAWTWGVAAVALGPSATLLIATALMGIGMLMGFGRLSLPALASPNLDPSNRWKAPNVSRDVVARSGPIKIMIEYLIREEDMNAFLTIMAERRRTRRRDGARRWSLVRGVENAELWIESYHFPTWMDYVRYNHRVTQADVYISEGLHSLHAGDEPPLVRRMVERPIKWEVGEHTHDPIPHEH
jgi:MFS family permease